MSDRYSFRARERARQQEREAFERRGRRMFWTGLVVPAIACTIVALAIGPDSWLGWAAVLATAPAAAAGVAFAFMLQDRAASRS
jgi:1,4-dihydroxy-2-naphthoate octaprenyltransferase